jgi:hypothetical protein
MFSIINYVEAKRRLKQSAETIEMMGGPKECNEMVLAQHEMIQLEQEYYRNKAFQLAFVIAVVVITFLIFSTFFRVFAWY